MDYTRDELDRIGRAAVRVLRRQERSTLPDLGTPVPMLARAVVAQLGWPQHEFAAVAAALDELLPPLVLKRTLVATPGPRYAVAPRTPRGEE